MSGKTICIIPALNAEATVEQVIVAVRRSLPDIHILGIDDGSTDHTRSILRRTCDTTLEFDINQGKGASLRAAFAKALELDATAVLTMDADGQHDATFAPRLLEGLANADIVIGARSINTATVPPHRRLANRLSSAATRAVTRCDICDSQSGYRAIRATVLQQVHARGDRYEFETDFLVRASHAGYIIRDVPVPTIYGPPSHFRALRDAWRVTRILWSHRSALFR